MARRFSWVVVFGFLLISLGGVLLHHSVRGLSAHSVLSGSMEPQIATGSIAIAVQKQQYGVGDIVVFIVPGKNEKIIHRITRVIVLHDGQEGIETKGDANTNGDPWQVPTSFIQGKVLFSVPLLGYVFQAEATPKGFLLTVGITFFGVILGELYLIRTGVRDLVSFVLARFYK